MDSDASNQPLLNANQRRHFEVLLASLEDALAEVIVAAESPDRGDDRALAVVRHDLPDGFADAALPRIAEAAALIRAAAERWQLSPRELSLRRAVRATLTAQLIRLEESTVEGLRGYGPID